MTQFNLDQILDTDLIPGTDVDGVTKTVTGLQFKALFGPAQLRLVSDVEWEFGLANNIIVTKNAEAADGVPPYDLKTEFDITISEEVVSEALARVPVNAQPLIEAETCVLSFGYTDATSGSTDSQDIWGYSSNIGGFSQIADPQNAGPSVIWSNEVNNRYGISSIIHNNKQILINPYQWKGTDGSKMMFVMTDGEKTKLLPWNGEKYYTHIDGLNSLDSAVKPVSRFFMDKRGVLCSAVYSRGIMQYPDITWDADGFPELDNQTTAQAVYITPIGSEISIGKYFKGAVYDSIADRVYFSNGQEYVSMELNPDSPDAYKLRKKRGTSSDNNCSVNIVFTSNYMIRTIIKADGTILKAAAMSSVDNLTQGVESSLLNSSTSAYPLFIANLDQSKIFKMLPGQSVKYMNYTDTGSPADDSSWKEYRPEPISDSGDIGGAGAIIEDPFTLVWYQDGKMQSWGAIPEVGSEASVKQTITDTIGDSVVSTVSKIVSLLDEP